MSGCARIWQPEARANCITASRPKPRADLLARTSRRKKTEHGVAISGAPCPVAPPRRWCPVFQRGCSNAPGYKGLEHTPHWKALERRWKVVGTALEGSNVTHSVWRDMTSLDRFFEGGPIGLDADALGAEETLHCGLELLLANTFGARVGGEDGRRETLARVRRDFPALAV